MVPFVCARQQSEAPGVITENGTRQTICKHMLYWQHQNPQTRNGSQSFQKAFRNNTARKCHRRRRRRRSLDKKNEKMKTHDRRTTQDRSRKKTKKSSTIEKRYAKLKQNADTRFDTQIERQFVTQIWRDNLRPQFRARRSRAKDLQAIWRRDRSLSLSLSLSLSGSAAHHRWRGSDRHHRWPCTCSSSHPLLGTL